MQPSPLPSLAWGVLGAAAPSPSLPPLPPYGGSSITYLVNISALGGLTCVVLFLFVKLQDDHRLPAPRDLLTKLLAIWRATDEQIAMLCGADASDYLALQRNTALMLLGLAIPGFFLLLPLNVYAGHAHLHDQFAQATVLHIRPGSWLLWAHVTFTIFVAALVHFSIARIDKQLQSSKFQESDASGSISAFTILVHGVPRGLAIEKQALVEYFEHLYPGKVYQVHVPHDICSFLHVRRQLLDAHRQLAYAQVRASEATAAAVVSTRYWEDLHSGGERGAGIGVNGSDSGLYQPLASASHVDGEDEFGLSIAEEEEELICSQRAASGCRCLKALRHWHWPPLPPFAQRWLHQGTGAWRRWFWPCGTWSWRDEVRWLESRIQVLEADVSLYRQGKARGAGVAFVIFRDVFTATRALRDASWKRRRRADLVTWRWQVSRAPPPGKVQWHHVGTSAAGRRVRSWAVNLMVFVVLVFWSSPLAMLTAINSAAQRLDPEALEHFHALLSWAKGSSWGSAVVFQFLPNVLIFVAMYIAIPAALQRLSKFERHLTVSGEQQAVLLKMVSFYLLNLLVLKASSHGYCDLLTDAKFETTDALVETTLEAVILDFGWCATHPKECDRHNLVNSTFIGSSALSAIAFLITSALLGISFDLLSPIPWLARHFQALLGSKLPAPSLLQRPSSDDETPARAVNVAQDALRSSATEEDEEHGAPLNIVQPHTGHPLVEQVLNQYPTSGPGYAKEADTGFNFDFPSYHSYNLTAFAMALLNCTVAPMVLPFGVLFFGYRYAVDKYNFLYTYRSRSHSLPLATDGKLIALVLRVMRALLCLYLAVMVAFFFVRGDDPELQMLVVLACTLVVVAKYGLEQLVGLPKERGLDAYFGQSVASVEQVLGGRPAGYEVLASLEERSQAMLA
eukprot:SM000172S03060  [mRNA]  locus=s172:100259:104525:+ [translate_table: standard]